MPLKKPSFSPEKKLAQLSSERIALRRNFLAAKKRSKRKWSKLIRPPGRKPLLSSIILPVLSIGQARVALNKNANQRARTLNRLIGNANEGKPVPPVALRVKSWRARRAKK